MMEHDPLLTQLFEVTVLIKVDGMPAVNEKLGIVVILVQWQ